MQITLTIDDSLVPSIDQFLLTQRRYATDPDTGVPTATPIFADHTDFIVKQVGAILHGVVSQYPTAAIRAQLAQKKQLDDAMLAAVQPTAAVVTAAPAAPATGATGA